MGRKERELEKNMDTDIQYMQRAIELAEKGIGYVSPNPLVGAVIVKDNQIIGEGYHERYGEAHAEINALKSVADDVVAQPDGLVSATMYVTLEPCCHFGKTPPCVDAIIQSGIQRVVIGLADPNPLVAGKSIEKMEAHGIDVTVGIEADAIQKMNAAFIKYITTKLPYVIMKTAMTLDGKIATVKGDSKWITSETARKYVHHIRHKVSAILVGIGTVFADDPSLTTRIDDLEAVNPIRIIIDSTCKIPLDSKVLNADGTQVFVATTDMADKEKKKALRTKGIKVLTVPKKNEQVDLLALMKILGQNKIESILVEGGAAVNGSFIEEGLVDRVMAFIAPKIVGGNGSKTPVGGKGIEMMNDALTLKNTEVQVFDKDILIQGDMEVVKCLQV